MRSGLERGLSLSRKSLGRVGPSVPGLASKEERVLRAVRRATQLAEFLAGRLGELRCGLPTGEVPPVAFLEVAYGAEEFRLRLVVGGSVVEGGTDHEFSADAHDAELLVPHRGRRVPAGSRHARLDEVPDDGEQPLQRFRLDRQVAPRGEGDEGLAGSVEKVDCDRPRALLRALASSHGILSTVPIRSTGKGGSWSSEALPAVAARRENRATEV